MEKTRPDRKQLFRFKQFEVDQRDCAMKISTDGVVLGALAGVGAPARILDIGTGTGVVALMLAQRYVRARIDAIEIDGLAADRAGNNFRQSPFSGRLQAHHTALETFSPLDSTLPYDLIVSNPPFFVDSLRNPDPRKGQARHAGWVFFETLLSRSAHWLSDTGSLQLILPPTLSEKVKQSAVEQYEFFPGTEVMIFSFSTDEVPVRVLLSLFKRQEFAFQSGVTGSQHFRIYEERGVHAQGYRQALSEFFLDF